MLTLTCRHAPQAWGVTHLSHIFATPQLCPANHGLPLSACTNDSEKFHPSALLCGVADPGNSRARHPDTNQARPITHRGYKVVILVSVVRAGRKSLSPAEAYVQTRCVCAHASEEPLACVKTRGRGVFGAWSRGERGSAFERRVAIVLLVRYNNHNLIRDPLTKMLTR